MRFTMVLLFGTILILSGCKIEQTFVFNKDFSGEMTHTIDYSSSNDIMDADSTVKDNGKVSLLPDSVLWEINAGLEEIDGVYLISLSDEDSQFKMKLGFDHLDALNEALLSEPGDTSDVNLFCRFRKEDDTFWVDFVVEDPTENTITDEHEADGLDMHSQDLYEMISYRFEFRFAQKINSVSGTPATVQVDGYSVVVEQSLQSIMAPQFERTLEVQLK